MSDSQIPHIMVVDDEQDVRSAVQFLLEDSGYRVTSLKKLDATAPLADASDRPDILVLDMLLSGSDGRAIVRSLKLQPATRAIPVIMFSAYPSAEASALDAGADAYLAKPFEAEDLLTTIERLLRREHA